MAVLMALGFLATAPAALAQTADSTNWAGYAVARPGVSFRSASAAWIQPKPSCRPGAATYSSYWVGIGGFNPGSGALEQVGTEIDCTRSGRTRSLAWYETVPAPALQILRPVLPGDRMSATVTVRGHVARLALRDGTRGWTFVKSLRVSQVDVSSAEWIVEAPSECLANACQTLPLANFGSASFTSVRATTSWGHTGSLADPRWRLTKIRLRPGGGQFGPLHAGGATPSELRAGGNAFEVDYAVVALQAISRAARATRQVGASPAIRHRPRANLLQ